MSMLLRLARLSLPLLLAACAATPAPRSQQAQAARVQSAGAPCVIHVYRTKTAYHSRNPEQPFIYIGDEQAGTLGVGESQCLRLAPGKYMLSIRQPMLFMPGITSDRLDFEVKDDQPMYIRYAKEFAGVSGTGNMQSTSRLQIASEEEWRQRR
jgi:hypothetical protein